MKNIAKNVFFSGRVQGVGFRYAAYRSAGKYDVTGYVRNLPDGRVELLAQGSESEVNDLIQDICSYFGSYIKEKKENTQPFSPIYHDFRISF